MGYQIVGITVICAWTSLIAIPYFVVMNELNLLRVDPAIEEIGLDVAELGGVSEEFISAVREQIRLNNEVEKSKYLPVNKDDEKDATDN